MFVSDAPPGASFRVKRVVLDKEVGRRLADMGFTEGVEGAVVRSGFFHDPIQVRIRGYDVLLRRSEAAGIEVEPVGDWSAARDAMRGRGGPGMGRGHGHGRGVGGGRGGPEWLFGRGHGRGMGRGRGSERDRED